MSLFLISTLRTLLEQLESPPMTAESATRVLTRHQTSLANVLPISYRDKIRRTPGVVEVSAYQWVGGIYKDPANFFAQFAVDPDRFFTVYSDIHPLAPEQKEAFMKEKTAALAGVGLTKRYGWKIGDRITLQGTILGKNIDLVIRGFVQDGGSENLLLLRHDYLNELWDKYDSSGVFAVRVRSAEEIPAVIDTIDSMFASSTAPTKTETEKAFVLGFVSMLGNVRTLVISISTVLIFTIILVAANTMAMSIRERTGEIAILRADRRICPDCPHWRSARFDSRPLSLRRHGYQRHDHGIHRDIQCDMGNCNGCGGHFSCRGFRQYPGSRLECLSPCNR
jgi:putative ABC transport system permease protein